MILFSILCTMYCGRGCVSLESERGKELAQSLKKNNERLRDFLLRTDNGQRTTGTRGVLRGPRGPKKDFTSKMCEHWTLTGMGQSISHLDYLCIVILISVWIIYIISIFKSQRSQRNKVLAIFSPSPSYQQQIFQECLDSVGPFWSASDQSRVGLSEDMQVFS